MTEGRSLIVCHTGHRQVFSEEQDNVQRAPLIYYDLSVKEVRQFTYQTAKYGKYKIQKSRAENEMAGADFFLGIITYKLDYEELPIFQEEQVLTITKSILHM